MFNNLRSLDINEEFSKENLENFLPRMRYLNSLTLPFHDFNQIFDVIYTQCRSLRKLTIKCINNFYNYYLMP